MPAIGWLMNLGFAASGEVEDYVYIPAGPFSRPSETTDRLARPSEGSRLYDRPAEGDELWRRSPQH